MDPRVATALYGMTRETTQMRIENENEQKTNFPFLNKKMLTTLILFAVFFVVVLVAKSCPTFL